MSANDFARRVKENLHEKKFNNWFNFEHKKIYFLSRFGIPKKMMSINLHRHPEFLIFPEIVTSS